MALIRSKNIKEFKSNIDWYSATQSDIVSADLVRDEFLTNKKFVKELIPTTNGFDSSSGTWSFSVNSEILNNNKKVVDVFVNGIKTNNIESVSGTLIILNQYDYDLDGTDKLEVKYLTDFPENSSVVNGFIDPDYLE